MSRQKALDNINLKSCDSWAHTEYSIHYHTKYLSRHTGLPESEPGFLQQGYDKLAFDFLFSTNNGLINWSKKGRTTDMGHASYAVDGSDKRQPVVSPFKDVEEVWAFDAVNEYGLPDFEKQVQSYENSIIKSREKFPNQLTPGGYYKTIISGAIESFGWEMLLMAAANPTKIEKVFDSFFKRTLFHMEAWAKTNAEVIIQHDDFVWTNGAFMNPDIYRKIIIPRYAQLWKPIHEAGKKVIFCSDGNFCEFAKDVAEAGADGFIFEPCMDFGYMVSNFGKTKCLVGSYVDCRDLTFSKWEKVKQDIDRTVEQLKNCAGVIVAVGNHLPPNIPEDMLDRYFDYLLPKLNK